MSECKEFESTQNLPLTNHRISECPGEGILSSHSAAAQHSKPKQTPLYLFLPTDTVTRGPCLIAANAYLRWLQTQFKCQFYHSPVACPLFAQRTQEYKRARQGYHICTYDTHKRLCLPTAQATYCSTKTTHTRCQLHPLSMAQKDPHDMTAHAAKTSLKRVGATAGLFGKQSKVKSQKDPWQAQTHRGRKCTRPCAHAFSCAP